MNDQTAAANLEITAQLAEAAEDILRDFANNAELDVALIVDHSGALIAGISADDNIHIDTVSALVAGTIGSIRALGKAVGETRSLESTHHGEDFIIYLRELNARFVVVGVATSDIPAGILREVAARISKPLLQLLTKADIVEKKEAESEIASPTIASVGPPLFDLTNTDSPEITEEIDDTEEDFQPEEVEEASELTAPSPEAIEKVDPPAETETDKDEQEEYPITEPATASAAPLVNSPFEFVLEDDDVEEEENVSAEMVAQDLSAESEKEEDPPANFESDAEEPMAGQKPLFEIGKEEQHNQPEPDESVSAPLLVSPAMSKARISDDDENNGDDDSHGVAAISVPIATEFAKKIESSNLERKATPTPLIELEKETEDEKEGEEKPQSSGGPRYVFDIG